MDTIALAQPILAALGLTGTRIATIETDDPFALGEMLRTIEPGDVVPRPASFQPVGSKREMLRLALRELHRAAPSPVDVVAMPAGAPVGRPVCAISARNGISRAWTWRGLSPPGG